MHSRHISWRQNPSSRNNALRNQSKIWGPWARFGGPVLPPGPSLKPPLQYDRLITRQCIGRRRADAFFITPTVSCKRFSKQFFNSLLRHRVWSSPSPRSRIVDAVFALPTARVSGIKKKKGILSKFHRNTLTLAMTIDRKSTKIFVLCFPKNEPEFPFS